ncbi:MAG: SprB repeat-containing protein, partial [Bacteroidota bacterium]
MLYLPKFKGALLLTTLFFCCLLPIQQYAQSVNLSVTIDTGDLACFGGSDGAVAAVPDGGVPPYSYLWSNGATNQILTGLPAGTYSVTVTDQIGTTASASGTVNEPAQTMSISLNANYETCVGSADAHAGVETTGGVFPYTYLWSNGGTTFIIEDLSAGIYTVTVTDAVGCTISGSIEVELSPEGIWLMTSSTPVSCNGGNDGTAHVSIMTGTPPFVVIWSDGQTGEDPVDLAAGTYSVTVTDVNGCTNEMTVDVTEPPIIDGFFNTNNNTDCASPNGSITSTIFGGTPGYTYQWSNGDNTPSINGLAAGDYTLTVTDANNCERIFDPLTITDNCPDPCLADAGSLTAATPDCL